MTDAYRDETGAAISAIDALRAENARLREQVDDLQRALRVANPSAMRGPLVAAALAATGIAAVVSIGVVSLMMRGQPAVAPPAAPVVEQAVTAPVEPAPEPATTPSPTKSTLALATSSRPADWQAARDLLEPKVFSGRASPAEVRVLERICKRQGDHTCVDECQSLEARAALEAAMQ